jgi:hypothetical protein
MTNVNLISIEKIEKAIYLIRGEKVMLDRDLASLYDVSTAALNQAVRRNRERFPGDFMFQLTSAETAELNRSQIVIGSEKHRDPRSRPYAFTELGVAMLSTVLRSSAREKLVEAARIGTVLSPRFLETIHVKKSYDQTQAKCLPDLRQEEP